MKTKLTLLLDEKVITLAKKTAKKRNTSVSKLFEESVTSAASVTQATLTPEIEKWFKSLPKVLDKGTISERIAKKLHGKKAA